MNRKEIVRRLSEDLYGRGDTSLVDRYYAEDYVNHDPEPGFSGDREGVRSHVEAVHAALDIERCEATHVLVEGDEAAVRWRLVGTHTGPFGDIPATNRRIDLNGMAFHRFRDGKVVEEWHRVDELGLMQQLGVLPEEFGAPA